MPKVRLFAAIREAAGCAEVEVEGDEIAQVLDSLREKFGPEFSRILGFCRVAVNGASIDTLDGDRRQLSSTDEVAILPPVSGG